MPYAKHCLGSGYQRERHMIDNASKTACDLQDARFPAFEGHSASADLAIETLTYERGLCKTVPGSIRHEEWSEKQMIYSWAPERSTPRKQQQRRHRTPQQSPSQRSGVSESDRPDLVALGADGDAYSDAPAPE